MDIFLRMKRVTERGLISPKKVRKNEHLAPLIRCTGELTKHSNEFRHYHSSGMSSEST